MSPLLNVLSDFTQNPVSIVIFIFLLTLILSLIIACMSEGWREKLVAIKVLEKDEKPSSLLFWVIGIIIVVKGVQGFLIQPFIVDGGSMLPTYHNKEFLLVDKLSYYFEKPARGDIIIFKLYEDQTNPYNGKYLIKRVIGLPGDRVVVENGITTIYPKSKAAPFVVSEPYVQNKDVTKNIDITLAEKQYFVMGDNRAQSYDSRSWGPLDEANIKGQVLLRVYPWSVAAYEPGQYKYQE